MRKSVSLLLVVMLMLGLTTMAAADKLGLGLVTSFKGKDVSEKDGKKVDGNVQVDTDVCTVILDDNNVIKAIKFDIQQSRLSFNDEGKVTTPADQAFQSKVEKGADYGMQKASQLEKGEWFQQAAAFEAYCIGKTVEEVLGTKTYKKDDNHTQVADVDELKTTCTIDLGVFFDTLKKAAANAQ